MNRRVQRAGAITCIVLAIAGLVTCTRSPRELPPCLASPAFERETKDPSFARVVAAGDIADCTTNKHFETAALVEKLAPDAVFVLGDLAYPNGKLDEFLDCYDPAWGKFRSITRPAVGNHEYHTAHAGPYHAYFCGSSGDAFRGYYSFDIGAWHVVSLNSNCGGDLDVPAEVASEFGGCDKDSPQAKWLRDDLAKHPSPCTAALWHHPVFNSGKHGQAGYMRDLWRILEDAGADLVLNGHAHDYERLAPVVLPGTRNDQRGMRQFVIGTGGRGLATFADIDRNSEVRQAETHGVLELKLYADKYEWNYVATTPGVTDRGETPCH